MRRRHGALARRANNKLRSRRSSIIEAVIASRYIGRTFVCNGKLAAIFEIQNTGSGPFCFFACPNHANRSRSPIAIGDLSVPGLASHRHLYRTNCILGSLLLVSQRIDVLGLNCGCGFLHRLQPASGNRDGKKRATRNWSRPFFPWFGWDVGFAIIVVVVVRADRGQRTIVKTPAVNDAADNRQNGAIAYRRRPQKKPF